MEKGDVSTGEISSISGTWAFGDDDLLGAEEIVSKPLFGRVKDQNQLLEAYQRVEESKIFEVVFVHGLSGSGKTVLVDTTFREKLLSSTDGRDGGYFSAGKFFQNQTSGIEPYSAIMTAFSDLCDLVTQSDGFDEFRQNEIRSGLLKRQEEAAMLGRMINLTPFGVEPQSTRQLMQLSPADMTRNDVTFAKLKSACKTFLQTMAAAHDHPIVIFLDDIQWMDEGSEQLIRAFLTDTSLQNVLLILAYRDEEAEMVDSLQLKSGNRPYGNIQLTNLDLASVQEMMCRFFDCAISSPAIVDLSDLVLKRTKGNPYFVSQFLETIVCEGLIGKDEDASWIFDVPKIQREIMAVSETLADLLYRKINHLSSAMKTILSIASLFGYCFDAAILLQVASHIIVTSDCGESQSTLSSQETIQLCLTEAVKAGFVEELEGEMFQFTHDKLYAAFASLLDEKEGQRLHFLIGEAFLDQPVVDPSMTYNAAVHFNEAHKFFSTEADRVRLARINLTAARYCQEMIAFDIASDLLRSGLLLLGDSQTRWNSGDDLFDLAFEMTQELGHTELSAGRFDSCKQTAAETVKRAKSIDMKLNGLLIGVECLTAANQIAESILAAKVALRELNVAKIPNRVSLRHLLPKLISVKRKMKLKTDQDILSLPIVQNRPIEIAVRLLSQVCVFSLLRDDDNQGVYAALLAMELTLQHGLSPHSSTAVAMLGAAEVTLGNYDKAYRYGKLAMQLLEVANSRDAECATVGVASVLLLHWKEPLSELKDALGRAAFNGLERGDFVYGAFCFWQFCFLNNLLGTSLEIVAETLRIQYERAIALGGHNVMSRWLEPTIQFIANLQSDSTDWGQLSNLTGEFMDAGSYIRDAEMNSSQTLVFSAKWIQAQLACYFGLYELAEARYKEIYRIGSTATKAAFATVPWYWFAGIIHYERYRSTGRGSSLRKARRCKRTLERMTSQIGCPNSSAAANMLRGKEISFFKHLSEEALALAFDETIEGLAQFPCFEAFTNEDAGFAFARLGCRERATKYFNRAMDIYYHDWGSFAKYQWLQEKSIEVLRVEDHAIGTASHVGAIILCQGSESHSEGEHR